MPPIPHQGPRLIAYHQTHHRQPNDQHISLQPLIGTPLTHLILGALHLNSPTNITLNDHPPNHPRNSKLWADLAQVQSSGIKVLLMLGGAAQGSYKRLDSDDATFETYYQPLAQLLREKNFDGIDLDIEEPFSLLSALRLIDRLHADFGPSFIITLAPVAAAMCNRPHISGSFSYEALEVLRGSKIAWYNTQFYCNWGDMSNAFGYEMILATGFPPEKVVVGILTNPKNAGAGWVGLEVLYEVLLEIMGRYGGRFGGISGWELFNALPGDEEQFEEWVGVIGGILVDGVGIAAEG